MTCWIEVGCHLECLWSLVASGDVARAPSNSDIKDVATLYRGEQSGGASGGLGRALQRGGGGAGGGGQLLVGAAPALVPPAALHRGRAARLGWLRRDRARLRQRSIARWAPCAHLAMKHICSPCRTDVLRSSLLVQCKIKDLVFLTLRAVKG